MSEMTADVKPMVAAEADVLISGGGFVGLALALSLAQGGVTSVVVDPAPIAERLDPLFDGRASAIAYAGYRLLEALEVWPLLADDAGPIREIRVSDGPSWLHLHFDHRELGDGDRNDGPLGYMVENRHLRLALHQAAASVPEITLLPSTWLVEATRSDGGVTGVTESGQCIRARLAVAAEGRRSPLRDEAGIKTYRWSYDQTGIVVTADLERPHHGIAHERFLPPGPFAILPLTGNRASIVWTERRHTAKALLALDAPLFEAEFRRRMGDYWGRVSASGPRWSYPLELQIAADFTAKRLALIGDAAHGIHPIAGQGLNLGLKDVAALAQCVVEAARLGQDIGDKSVLETYARWRRFDTLAMIVATDGLNRLFSNHSTVLRLARDAGLAAVNKMPTLKRYFMNHARGTLGDLPRLLKGERV